jgi:ABC-2 type transport system permease protein
MRKTLRVLRYELISTLTRPSFLLISIGLPLLGLIILGILSLSKGELDSSSEPVEEEAKDLLVEGYVDFADIIDVHPQDLPEGLLVPFDNEAQAREAMATGEITAYYVIPGDYERSGDFVYVHPDYTPLSPKGQDWVMRWTLLVNTLNGDIALAGKIWNPVNLRVRNISSDSEHDRFSAEDCTTPGYRCESNVLVQMLPLGVVILFFIFLSASSGILLKNVSSEKQNRMMEILMLSTNPRQLFTGKLIGLGIASLLQVLIWVVSIFAMFRLGGQTLNLPEGFQLPFSLVLWWILLFLLGYAVYASLMAGLGALVPDLKAGSQVSIFILFPLLISYMLSTMPFIQEDPHSLLVTLLSLFPFSSPVLMMMRITIGGVPWWQQLLCVVLMVLTAVLIVRAVARLFKAQTLLSGSPFSMRRYLAALLGKA